MTDDEFKAIKEAEKERLRAKRNVASLRRTLKQRGASEKTVAAMEHRVRALLDETTSLTQRMIRTAARGLARAELALESDEASTPPEERTGPQEAPADPLDEGERLHREARADAFIDHLKRELAPERSSGSASDPVSDDPSPSDDASASASTSDDEPPLPEKTIGRHR